MISDIPLNFNINNLSSFDLAYRPYDMVNNALSEPINIAEPNANIHLEKFVGLDLDAIIVENFIRHELSKSNLFPEELKVNPDVKNGINDILIQFGNKLPDNYGNSNLQTNSAEFMSMMFEAVNKNYLDALNRMQDVTNDLWFIDNMPIAYSNIFRWLWYKGDTKDLLISAFANSGTFNGLIDLLRALFGSNAIINLTNSPASIGIEVTNSNQELQLTIATDDYAIANNNDLVNAGINFSGLSIQDINQLIIDFLPVGVKLGSLAVS